MHTKIKKAKAISLQSVEKVFRTKSGIVHVLKDINLDVFQDSFTILYGPSGSGKSTLLNLIAGLEESSSGQINVLGREYEVISNEDITAHRRENIGVVYQIPVWIKSLTVVENVALPLTIQGVKQDERLFNALQQLKRVGMQDWADNYPSELSGGQQQKISLARALINNPDLILADEPTGNLDFQSTQDILQIFQDLRNDGKTVIMVTHNLELVSYADYVIRLFDGSIVDMIEAKKQNEKKIKQSLIETISKGAVSRKTVQDFDEEVKEKSKTGILDIFSILFIFLKNFRKVIWTLFIVFFFSIYNVFLKILSSKRVPKPFARMLPSTMNIYFRFTKWIDGNTKGAIKYSDIIGLSLKNIFSKRARSLITVSGISISIGLIVLLISIGYGIEQLIINSFADSDERKYITVENVSSGNNRLNDEYIERVKQYEGVNDTFPAIELAGRVNINSQNEDVVVLGVSDTFLETDLVELENGRLFKDQSLAVDVKRVDIRDFEDTTDTIEEINLKAEVALISPSISGEVLVNNAFKDEFSLDSEDLISFNMSLVEVGNVALNPDFKTVSEDIAVDIVGTTNFDEDLPIILMPISDTRKLGVDQYSKLYINVEDERDIELLQTQIFVDGFNPVTVQDTIQEIENVFVSVRFILIGFGSIGLLIAGMGMFNTLTVSLLERIREVGLYKALGIKSTDIEDLFLTEAIAMGAFGGLGGVVLGYFLGESLSLGISVFAVSQGAESVDVSFLPAFISISVLIISLLVGMITGYWPAHRAKNISALDALRYE